MNTKKYLIGSLLSFVAVFIFDWVFHGMILKPAYEATSELWRAEEDCIFWAMMLGQLMLPFVFNYIYIGWSKRGCKNEGLLFGLLIGLLFVPTNLIFYAVQPLPFSMILYWMVGGILQCMMLGFIIAKVHGAVESSA